MTCITTTSEILERREYEKCKNKIIELQNILLVKEKVIENSDEKYRKLCSQISEFEQKEVKFTDNYQFERQFKDQLEDKQDTINELRRKETCLVDSNEKLKSEVKKLKCDIDLEKERVNTYKKSKENVDYELKQARQRLSELEEQLSSGRIDSVITEQQSNQMLIELQDLTNQVKNLKKDKTNLGEDNCNLRKQIEQLEVTISKNEHDLARYEKLIQTLERSKEDLIEKLQNTSKEKNYEERDRQQLITDIRNLKKILVQKEGEIEEMRNSVIELDQRNDMLQNQLDYKTEELYQTQEVLQHQNAENTASKQRILFISSKEESYEKRLQEREKEIIELT